MTSKTICKKWGDEPVIKIRNTPYGDPNKLLDRIANIASNWADNQITDESAMSKIDTILRQNHRLRDQPAPDGYDD